ncbi:tyrosine-type recombinase/integrase [Methylobacter sp.]
MITLRQAVDEYIALRQAMGFKLYEESRLLPRFIGFLEDQGEAFITSDLAVRWATQCRAAQPAEWAKRLRFVRVFARYRSATDPRTQIPPTRLLPYRARRAEPYIYNEDEIKRLLQAASQLCSPTGLRAHTYVTALGLLAVTGMRISELVKLDNEDVDLAHGQLTICGAKCGKSRWLPLHPTTQQALQRYIQRRDKQYPILCSSGFFVSEQGTRLTTCTVRATFVHLSRQIGFRGPTDSHGPRLPIFGTALRSRRCYVGIRKAPTSNNISLSFQLTWVM